MANPSTPFGFLEYGLRDGESPNFGMFPGSIGAANTGSIYGGDVAGPPSSGIFAAAAVVTDGATIGGIFAPDFSYLSISQGMRSRNRAWLGAIADIVSGDTVRCRLINSPSAIFEVRSSGASGSAVPATAVGKFANFSIPGTPGNNLISGYALDDNTINATQGVLPFLIVGLAQQPRTDPTSIYNIVLVRMVNLAPL